MDLKDTPFVCLEFPLKCSADSSVALMLLIFVSSKAFFSWQSREKICPRTRVKSLPTPEAIPAQEEKPIDEIVSTPYQGHHSSFNKHCTNADIPWYFESFGALGGSQS